jgi:nitrogen-specific signal transduction histidine kinase
MRFFRTEVWSYAVLLIILFAIATIAVRTTLAYIGEQVPIDSNYRVVVAVMWSLTLGFMLIAGSYGLWAIKFAGESEARKRVGRLVDTMDYLRDGLLAVDEKGRITGSNPAARRFAGTDLGQREQLGVIFPCLSEQDIALLMDKDQLAEIEREMRLDGASRSVRFRSQSSEDLVLVLLSDVTSMNVQRIRSRQAARLQLVGEIARGVAHDFNNLLCGISGYASILAKVPPGSPEMAKSTQAISQNVERGISLAGHLLQLAQPAAMTRFTDMTIEHVEAAAGVLRESLPAGWQIEVNARSRIPAAVALSGIQIEQVVMNLGFLAADHCEKPSVLNISVGTPEPSGLLAVGSSFAGTLVVSATGGDGVFMDSRVELRKFAGEAGVIQSVIRSMLDEAGGRLDCMETADASPIFRVCLPFGHAVPGGGEGDLSDELKAYISNWHVLLAKTGRGTVLIEKRLKELGVKVSGYDTITSVLAAIEESAGLDAMILDARLLGQEVGALLKAILKIRPTSGVVVICEDPGSMPRELSADVVFESVKAGADKVLASMIEAKSLSARRRK